MKTIPFHTAADFGTRAAAQKGRQRALRHSLRQALTSITAMPREWRRRARSRAELAMLDERMLRDIGVTRADIWREVNKPFWRQ